MAQDRGFCRVVLLGRDDVPVGCGFICGPAQVMTCTHVVRSAAGLDGEGPVAPGTVVKAVFPTAPGQRSDLRLVVGHPERDGLLADIALLELCEDNAFPRDFRIAASRLATCDQRLSIAGVGASAAFQDVQIMGPTGEYSGLNRIFVRAEGQDSEVAFERGCSGTPVYDDRFGLVGMAAERQADRTGFIIPIQLLRHVWRLADLGAASDEEVSTVAGDAFRDSFVGPPFRHDVFLSFARADLADPATRLADTIAEVEAVIHRSDACGTAIVRAARTTDDAPLGKADRAAAQSSALLFVFLSRAFLASAACREELDAFFAQARADGRTAAHAVLCLLEPLSGEAAQPWPDALLEDGRPPASVRTLGPDADNYRAWQDAVAGMVGEVRVKLKAIAGQMVATRPPPVTVEPSGQVYLQSHRDPAGWLQAKLDLENDSFVVVPQPMEQEASGIAQQISQDDQRLRLLYAADGYVLIRTAPDDPTGLQASLGWGALRRVRQEFNRPLGWVLLDWVGDAGPTLPRNLPLRRISVSDPDWRTQLRSELGIGA